ncbi:hypothetical protein GEV33_003921 [Tenebrio molitor]|uniref:Uncharacterized protein n=1 Tax=Tenebrio molitor TaxID=7067 RepID=A0A8J6LEV4_TENMO|nr:hypothetical protein GEV33_003921 [Tenebrio molitor]
MADEASVYVRFYQFLCSLASTRAESTTRLSIAVCCPGGLAYPGSPSVPAYTPMSIQKHEISKEHVHAALKFKLFGKQQSIAAALDSGHRVSILRHNEKMEENRDILKRLVDMTLYLSIQELVFRGHDETETSLNQGNFKELANLLSEVTSRPITQPEQKKTFCLKRRAGFAKIKKNFFHPGLDRYEAVDVSGDPDFLGDFLGPTVDDEIQAWNLTPHSGVWFFTNLPSGIRKSAPRRLGLDFLDSSSSLTLFGPSTSPHPFLAVQPLAVSAPFTVPHRSDLSDQRPKTKKPIPASSEAAAEAYGLFSSHSRALSCLL